LLPTSTESHEEQERIKRIFKKEQSLDLDAKIRARVVMAKWDGIDAEKRDKLAEQRGQQALQRQGLRERYPDLFPPTNSPTPKKPA